jgi:hypothetical protein
MTMEAPSKREYLPPVGVALRGAFPRDSAAGPRPVPPAACVARFLHWRPMSTRASRDRCRGGSCTTGDCE